jgi:hypothetical protein
MLRIVGDYFRDRGWTRGSTKGVRFGLIDNWKVNAALDEGANDFYIGLYAGLPWAMLDILSSLLASPAIFSEIGMSKPSFNLKDTPTLTVDYRRLKFLPENSSVRDLFGHSPRDETRLQLVEYLWILSLTFVVVHELGHIVNGHLALRKESPRSGRMTELPRLDDIPWSPELSCALERDADSFAAGILFNLSSSRDFGPEYPGRLGARANQLRCALVTVGATLLRLNHAQLSQFTGQDPYHPPAEFRFTMIANEWWKVAEDLNIEERDRAFELALQDIHSAASVLEDQIGSFVGPAFFLVNGKYFGPDITVENEGEIRSAVKMVERFLRVCSSMDDTLAKIKKRANERVDV